ncbi:DRMBL-domain-containing protein [Daedalea quercina L-15889]|uniref:DRMBL-domain-containing protein n=1 Tax=Daedalea quercina L-15889 TaxID=1314783 RepID=A0A165NTF4_9APHY|nr:DRMBL-domain-containing protein [Daedalea quercina L-15889]
MSKSATSDTRAASPSASTSIAANLKSLRPVSSYQAATPSSSKVKLEDSEPSTDTKAGAFSILMTSHKENEAWKEASVAEDRNFRPTKSNGGRRKAPFYKVMQGMPIAVDAFRYGAIPGVTAYFLTHAHSDHYTNLSAKWDNGPIYCSEGTANLIVHMLGVDRQWVHPLPLDVATTIPDTGGVQVTPIEANHCPGSCLFLFEGAQTINAGDSVYKSQFVGSSKVFRYLHCGDFRASPAHVMHPAIKGKRIDHVYLDTTYLDPKYCFPPQPQVISACAELARRIVAGIPLHEDAAKAKQNRTMDGWVTTATVKTEQKEQDVGRTLVVVGTYSIGKERIITADWVTAIARALQTKVFCDSRKAAILRCQADPELHSMLTKDPLEGGVHLVPLGVIASDRLKEYVERFKGHYSKAVGFRPTGWTFTAPTGTDTLPAVQTIISRSQSRTFTYTQLNPMKNMTAALQVYGVPYSEHSSFFELTCFALSLDWGKMIATVNVGSENARKKMGKWIERWDAERKKRGKGEVVGYRAEDYW